MCRHILSILAYTFQLILSNALLHNRGTTAFQFARRAPDVIFLTSQFSLDSRPGDGRHSSLPSFSCSTDLHVVYETSLLKGGVQRSLGFVQSLEECAGSCCSDEEGCSVAVYCLHSHQCSAVSCSRDVPCSLIESVTHEAGDAQDKPCQVLRVLPQDDATPHTPLSRMKNLKPKRSSDVSPVSHRSDNTNKASSSDKLDTNTDQSRGSTHHSDGTENVAHKPLAASFGTAVGSGIPSSSSRSDSIDESSVREPPKFALPLTDTKHSNSPANFKKKPTTVEFHAPEANIKTNSTDHREDDKSVETGASIPSVSRDASDFVPHVCEIGLPDCSVNEFCEGYGGRRRDGLCRCIEGYMRNQDTHICESKDGGGAQGAAAGAAGIGSASSTSGSSAASPSGLSAASPNGLSAGTISGSVSGSGSGADSGSSTDNISGSVADSTDGSGTDNTITISAGSMTSNTTAAGNSSSPYVPRVLDVGVTNKTVRLPAGKTIYDQEVTLSAYVIGECPGCQYEWSLIQGPDTVSAGSLTEPHSQTAMLANLVPGTYLFSVKVSQPGDTDPSGVNRPAALGSTVANLTVLKAPQSNKPPEVTIVPPRQKVTLPTTAVILDGSGSVDDNTESSKLDFRWEIVSGPLDYSLEKQVGQTLTLQNLLPGNYTIMLRVKDAEGLEGKSTAVVEVVQEKDYPPSANAGGDQIIYLPQTETLVNGNASSDDHGIVEWEWTKGSDVDGLAVDMQDTRTPILKLSGLEEGHYQFVLKVIDGSGQSDSSAVNIYVHTPDVTALVADAGPDITVSLPVVNVTLDGSNSKGVLPTTNVSWTQVSGPSTAKLLPYSTEDRLKVNATGLTRGIYVFQLQLVNDDKARVTADTTTVTIKQEHNLQPKANGGGDFSVMLPVSLVQVNGSSSTDDVGIVKWRWERLPRSLAAGQVLGQSASSPVLMLTGLVEGQYQWKLTVWDDQGASDSDTVSFIVKSGPHHKDLVAVVLGAGIESVSAAQLSNLLQALKMVLRTGHTLQLIDFSGVPYTGECSAVILGYDSGAATPDASTTSSTGGGGGSPYVGEVVEGVRLAAMLQSGVKAATASAAADVFEVSILAIHPVVCQNNCSGHGECDQARRECVCRSWWMESFWRRHFGDAAPNCDWSVIYVFVSSVAIGSLVVIVLWVVITLLVRRRRRGGGDLKRGRNKRWGCFGGESGTSSGGHRRRGGPNGLSRYMLLEEDGFKMRSRSSLLDSSSDSGSDAEVLFDSRGKTRHKGSDKRKNGLLKPPAGRLRT
ncbi:PKD domain [Trinorchestia longiramus]|nr:PKD domain [Trinorchestia longiramus]